ncbi:hypothetical protein [Cloacibacillus porcorum]|uniref:hypothetical protein n=1 Tax=Cloacibacillus porcorum TaxID=1197717 RepID=UPI003F001B8E
MRVSGRKQRRRICQPPLELPFRIVFTAFTAFAVIYSGDIMKNDMVSLRQMFAASRNCVSAKNTAVRHRWALNVRYLMCLSRAGAYPQNCRGKIERYSSSRGKPAQFRNHS